MNGYIILFFLSGPVILAISKLWLGPKFDKSKTIQSQFNYFLIETMVYLVFAGLIYYLVLRRFY